MLTDGGVPAVTDSIRRGDATISPPQTLASVLSVLVSSKLKLHNSTGNNFSQTLLRWTEIGGRAFRQDSTL